MRAFQHPQADARLLSVEEAQQLILDGIHPLETETIRFDEAAGRVLREDVVAARDVPPADNSAMDGYAVIAADTEQAPVPLRVIGEVAAGHSSSERVMAGTAMRIMTGAPVPAGADAVANVEITDGGPTVVRVMKPVAAGRNIRRAGEDMRAGDVVLQSGIALRAAEIGVLATARKTSVRVGRKPRVAILATGDEIADAFDENTAKTINSNSYALAALVREAGGEPIMHGIVGDDRDATIDAIRTATDADFIVSSGGVSVGAYDYVRDALDALGAQVRFWRVAMKPGKPVLFATIGERAYFGLPGNPVSSIVSFVLFVAPALRKAAGQTANVLPPIVDTVAAAPLRSAGDRRTYLRVRVTARGGELHCEPMPAQGSGVSTSLVQANGLAIIDEGTKTVDSGGRVATLLLASPFRA